MSESSDAYLVALRAILDAGLAARVAVDRATLYGLEAATDPQAIVVAGYAGDTFVCHDPLGDGAPLSVSTGTLLAAERAMAKAMRAPWQYNATTLVASDSARCDTAAIWRRNGQSLRGSEEGAGYDGTAVIERAAKVLLNRATRNDAAALTESLRSMAATRAEMAAYLSDVHAAQPDALAAADALAQASAIYAQCHTLATDGLDSAEEAREIGLALREAAQLERDAGDAMIDQAQSPS